MVVIILVEVLALTMYPGHFHVLEARLRLWDIKYIMCKSGAEAASGRGTRGQKQSCWGNNAGTGCEIIQMD